LPVAVGPSSQRIFSSLPRRVQHLRVAEDSVLAVVVRIVEESIALLPFALLDDGSRTRGFDGRQQVLRGVGG
jgi:hypothetical protein